MLNFEKVSFYLEPGKTERSKEQLLKQSYITICFSVDSVKAAFKEYETLKISILMKYTEYSTEYAMFMIPDPDGNVIEIAGEP